MEENRNVKFVRFQPSPSMSPPHSPPENGLPSKEAATPFTPLHIDSLRAGSAAEPHLDPGITPKHRRRPSSFLLHKGVEYVKRGTHNIQRKVQGSLVEDKGWELETVLDPRSKFMREWNKFFVCSALMAAFVDPLFFFLSEVDMDRKCVVLAYKLAVTVTVLRSVADFIYFSHMLLQFRLAYVEDTSQAFGTGDLVTDPRKVAYNYLRNGFLIDFFAMLPLPQFVLWVAVPRITQGSTSITKNYLRLVVILQYVPRVLRVFPLQAKMRQPLGVVFETAWSGFVVNLAVFMISAHVTGACWYLLGIERIDRCWRNVCDSEEALDCSYRFFDCKTRNSIQAAAWVANSSVIQTCIPKSGKTAFDYGIYQEILKIAPTVVNGFSRYFYALWYGLKNISSVGQNMVPSTFIGEIVFCIIVAVVGLLLFSMLVGNMQTYLASLSQKLEEMREHRRDTEAWMAHRALPSDMRRRIREYARYKWAATRGVDESQVLADMPDDLRRDIKRHLCLNLVRKVPLFEEVDDLVLDAICERLKPMWYIKGSQVIREGDPVIRMLFIIRGQLESVAAGGGRSGFLDAATLRPGDFCGDELLTWCLEARARDTFPKSTRSTTAEIATEAFALEADDVIYVTTHFRSMLHLRGIKRAVRYNAPHWRTWAANAIQSAWRRWKKKRDRDFVAENAPPDEASTMANGAAVHAAAFAASAHRTVPRSRGDEQPADIAMRMQKPVDVIPSRGRAFFDEEDEDAGSLYSPGVATPVAQSLPEQFRPSRRAGAPRSGPVLLRQNSTFLQRVSENEIFLDNRDEASDLGTR